METARLDASLAKAKAAAVEMAKEEEAAAAAQAAAVAAALAAAAPAPAPAMAAQAPAPAMAAAAAKPDAPAPASPAPTLGSLPAGNPLESTLKFKEALLTPGEAHTTPGALSLDPKEITLGRSIAPGAFAEVFRGLLWGQKVAVKRLFTDREGADAASLRKELLHETRLLAALSHPCILTLIGYTDEPAQIVLEVLDGTVYDLVKSGTSDIDGGMLSPLLDILSGCAYLHARSPPVIHRDLKPPNVLHDASKRCKLCDFGTAFELKPNQPKPTEWMGSQLYVAPEVDRLEPYGLPSDVFSFGTMAYELYHLAETGVDFYGEGDMFDGGGMFEGLETLRAPLLKTPQEYPVRPGSCEVDEVWELLKACMNAEADKRPSFGEVASKIGAARQKLPGKHKDWL